MYTSSSELIINELPNNVIRPIYNIFEDSITVYNELLNEKKDLFKGNYLTDIRGRLINFILKRFFDSDRIPKNFPFEVCAAKMAFGQKRTELSRNKIILTLGKAQTPNTLPPYAKYKTEYAKGNCSIGKQLKMNFDGDLAKYVDIPYYGVITYNIEDNVLKFLNIIIPDSNYKYIIDSVPITQSLRVVTNDDTLEDDRILNRENIKKEALETVDRSVLERGSI